MAYDWSRFSLKIPIRASVDEIYARWATSEGLRSWFLRQADFVSNEGVPRAAAEPLRPGDKYVFRWFGYPDEVEEKGVVLSANHKDEFSFSFGKAGNVAVHITPFKDMTICQLEQTGIPTDEESIKNFHIGCTRGWLFYLVNLKSLLEGGIDLRNRDLEIEDVVNA